MVHRVSRLRRLLRLEVIIITCLTIKLILSAWSIYADVDEEQPKSPQAQKNTIAATKTDTPSPTHSDMGLGLLDVIKERQAELDEREERLKRKEAELNELEREIEEKITQLNTAQKKIEQLLAQGQKVKDKNIKHLAEVYSSMKAEKAAKLIEELDESIAVDVLRMMDGNIAGTLLSFVDPNRAARLSTALTQNR
jgi:flagellar motility protein MotE (MotC chaperone)